MINSLLSRLSASKNILIFALLWMLTLVIYIPTVKAGWVIDAVGGIYNMKHLSFMDFINGKQSSIQSLYQLYAITIFIFYKLWGVNPWLWSLSFISLHAVNAFLAFLVCKNILADSSVKNSVGISLCGAILFTVCPHISEVIIWKACFHYLQGFFFILLALHFVQQYQHRPKPVFVWGALLLFALSAFSLEIFYLTPWFTLSLALYYRFGQGYERAVFKKTIGYFFIPQLLMLGAYFAGIYIKYSYFTPHVNNVFSLAPTEYLSKPPKYLFHILSLGRYFSFHAKENVSAFFGRPFILIIFYSILFLISVDVVTRFKAISGTARAMFLFFVWMAMTILFLMPLPFPGTSLLVFYDRYAYFASGFAFVFLALAVSRYVNKYVAAILFLAYAGANLFCTIKVNRYWKHSAYITNRLMANMPDAGGKTVLLLNLPENMNGVPMIGAQPDGQFKMMNEILAGKTIPNQVYDVASYNMLDDHSGAHVIISNDSMIHVTLNQWNTWWWYEGHGAKSYETRDYKVQMTDPGHWYELTLKRPAQEYLILFQTGDEWRVVDMNKRNEDQY